MPGNGALGRPPSLPELQPAAPSMLLTEEACLLAFVALVGQE